MIVDHFREAHAAIERAAAAYQRCDWLAVPAALDAARDAIQGAATQADVVANGWPAFSATDVVAILSELARAQVEHVGAEAIDVKLASQGVTVEVIMTLQGKGYRTSAFLMEIRQIATQASSLDR